MLEDGVEVAGAKGAQRALAGVERPTLPGCRASKSAGAMSSPCPGFGGGPQACEERARKGFCLRAWGLGDRAPEGAGGLDEGGVGDGAGFVDPVGADHTGLAAALVAIEETAQGGEDEVELLALGVGHR